MTGIFENLIKNDTYIGSLIRSLTCLQCKTKLVAFVMAVFCNIRKTRADPKTSRIIMVSFAQVRSGEQSLPDTRQVLPWTQKV